MIKYKMGVIIKEVSKSSEKWYIAAGWKKVESKDLKNKEKKDDKANSQKTAAA